MLALFALQVALAATSPTCGSDTSIHACSLLQTRHRAAPSSVVATESEGRQNKTSPAQMQNLTASQPTGVNPSGAAATLDEVGYASVADRCCQSEMIELVKRQVTEMGMEVCLEPGLRGVVAYHSCEYYQSFAKLTSDLLRDSTARCGWLRNKGLCQPLPDDCPPNPSVIPFYDCGCNKTIASKLDLASATVVSNNLGGIGPQKTDPHELRFRAGTSYSGVPFDLVIINLTEYTPGNIGNNGKDGGFGRITMKCDTDARFRFSFVEQGSYKPVVQDEVHMATYDLDGGGTGGLETVSSIGYTGYVTDPNPNLLADLDNDQITFKSIGKSWDNPSDPTVLTPDQRRNAIMFFYKGVSSFDVKFGIEGGDKGRALFFSFECALNDRCGH